MYTIGEFSKIGSVSAKTLRYYDEIGLLRPTFVDEMTHYRYYSEQQVNEILLIAELKTYDLRLEQIKAIMENNDIALLEHFLQKRIEQINAQIQENVLLRQHIEKKMHEIQRGASIMDQKSELKVEAKTFEPVWVMSKSATIVINQVGAVIGSVYEEIFKNHLQPAGPVMTFYWDKEFQAEHANIEVCVPVVSCDGMEKIQGIKQVNPGLCATCTYIGPYHNLGRAYAAVLKWMDENHYKIASAPFDAYMNDPKTVMNPEAYETQVWFPITK